MAQLQLPAVYSPAVLPAAVVVQPARNQALPALRTMRHLPPALPGQGCLGTSLQASAP